MRIDASWETSGLPTTSSDGRQNSPRQRSAQETQAAADQPVEQSKLRHFRQLKKVGWISLNADLTKSSGIDLKIFEEHRGNFLHYIGVTHTHIIKDRPYIGCVWRAHTFVQYRQISVSVALVSAT